MSVPAPGSIRAWVLHKLDNDSVRQWVGPYCAVWLLWATLAIFRFPPVYIIEDAMGHTAYVAWLWVAIYGNLAVITGLSMRHGGSAVNDMSTLLLARDWMGLFWQCTGHAVCSILLMMFEVSVIIGALTYDGPQLYAGMTIFAGFMLLPWTFGTAFLCAQCIRKFHKGLQLEKGVRP